MCGVAVPERGNVNITQFIPLMRIEPTSVAVMSLRPVLNCFLFFFLQVFNAVYNSDDNVFVGAPSGSGKSVIAELSLLRLLSTNEGARAVYLLPKDALADIVFADWYHKFGTRFNLKVR